GVGQRAERGRRYELAQRVAREEQADDDGRRAEGLGVERQQRDDDAEPDQIHDEREEDDEERTAHGYRVGRDGTQPSQRRITSDALAPPNPNEVEIAVRTSARRGSCGT